MPVFPTTARTIITHPENWVSDKLLTVEVADGNRFEFQDYQFQLVDVTPTAEEQDCPEDDPDFMYLFELRGESWEHPLFKVHAFRSGLPKCTAMDGSYVREAGDPVEAAIKMLAFTL